LDFSKKTWLKITIFFKSPKNGKMAKTISYLANSNKKGQMANLGERESVNPSLCLGLPQKKRRKGLYTLGIFEHNIEIKR
jgi:hypothetical protein